MRYAGVLAALLLLAVSSGATAADHPQLSELTPLLTRPIDTDEVQGLVKQYRLGKTYEVDSGSFDSEDHAYALTFREDRIVAIILRASPWPQGSGGWVWTTYSHPLPRKLKATDGRKEVRDKLGKPTKPAGDRWIDAVWVTMPAPRP